MERLFSRHVAQLVNYIFVKPCLILNKTVVMVIHGAWVNSSFSDLITITPRASAGYSGSSDQSDLFRHGFPPLCTVTALDSLASCYAFL